MNAFIKSINFSQLAQLAGLDSLIPKELGITDQLMQVFKDSILPGSSGETMVNGMQRIFNDYQLPVKDQDLSNLITNLSEPNHPNGMIPLDQNNPSNIQTRTPTQIKKPKSTKTVNQTYSFDPKGILDSGELHPNLVDRLRGFLNEAQSQGLNVFLFEGYRDIATQNELYQKGGVTNAGGGNSYHNYGLAADIVFYDDKGGPSWSSSHDWQKLGDLGKSFGLKWGGDFQTIKDLNHFQLKTNMSLGEIKNIYKNQGIEGVWDAAGN